MKRNIEIKQGATFEATFYWYNGADVVVPITAVTLAYPAVCTAVAHGLPTGDAPVSILGAKGTTAINTESLLPADRIYATKVATDTFSIPVNTRASSAYTGQGYLVYTAPVDLSAYTARLQIRRTPATTTTLLSLTSASGAIVLGADGSVAVTITPVLTAALSFTSAVYDLELISPTDDVTRLVEGTVTLSKEVTR